MKWRTIAIFLLAAGFAYGSGKDNGKDDAFSWSADDARVVSSLLDKGEEGDESPADAVRKYIRKRIAGEENYPFCKFLVPGNNDRPGHLVGASIPFPFFIPEDKLLLPYNAFLYRERNGQSREFFCFDRGKMLFYRHSERSAKGFFGKKGRSESGILEIDRELYLQIVATFELVNDMATTAPRLDYTDILGERWQTMMTSIDSQTASDETARNVLDALSLGTGEKYRNDLIRIGYEGTIIGDAPYAELSTLDEANGCLRELADCLYDYAFSLEEERKAREVRLLLSLVRLQNVLHEDKEERTNPAIVIDNGMEASEFMAFINDISDSEPGDGTIALYHQGEKLTMQLPMLGDTTAWYIFFLPGEIEADHKSKELEVEYCLFRLKIDREHLSIGEEKWLHADYKAFDEWLEQNREGRKVCFFIYLDEKLVLKDYWKLLNGLFKRADGRLLFMSTES